MLRTTNASSEKLVAFHLRWGIIASEIDSINFCESREIGQRLASRLYEQIVAKGAIHTVKNLGPVVLLVMVPILVTNSFAAHSVVQSSVMPEPALLVLLGGGLVGLATLIRRHLGR